MNGSKGKGSRYSRYERKHSIEWSHSQMSCASISSLTQDLSILEVICGFQFSHRKTETILWFNPGRQLGTRQPLTHSSPRGVGKRIKKEEVRKSYSFKKVEVRKLVDSDKDALIHKGKAACTSQAKQGIHSLLPIVMQMFSHFQESRTSSCIMVT